MHLRPGLFTMTYFLSVIRSNCRMIRPTSTFRQAFISQAPGFRRRKGGGALQSNSLSFHSNLGSSHYVQRAFFASGSPNSDGRHSSKKSGKDGVADEFDELARKDGFDSSTARMAVDATFEDLFDDDDDIVMEGFENDSHVHEKDGLPDSGDEMESRIKAAQRDMSTGRVSIPEELDEFAQSELKSDLRDLGFRKEVNPFGNDESPRRNQFKLMTNAMTCSACGSEFQATNEHRAGYLPPEKFEVQTRLAKIEEMQELKEKAESKEWTTEDEIAYLIHSAGDGNVTHDRDDGEIDVDKMAEELGLDLAELSRKRVICKRCHGLQHFGKVDKALRPGWTDEPTMSQEEFRKLLRPISEKPAVIIALVDLFDFGGSVLRELDGIAGDNPVILAANKVDLIPSKLGSQRAENWVRRELEYMGVKSLANIGGAVRLVSCKTGRGVFEMLRKARKLADEKDCDVYVVGAANAGKSTLINHVLGKGETKAKGKIRPGNRNAFRGALTTSPLPGTTLKFIKVDLGDGKGMYDTPGLLVPGTMTQLLTPEELKIVCPNKPVEPITFRVASGKCVLVGGLARIEVMGDSRPFLFTFFVANGVKLHPTDASRADTFVEKHAGDMLTPPLAPGPDRMTEIGAFDTHVIDIEGAGWKQAAADITLAGLGWVAVTGAGSVKVKVSVPRGIGVSVRPPLMPFDVWEVAAKYTGAKSTRKSGKSKSGRRRKGVGRN